MSGIVKTLTMEQTIDAVIRQIRAADPNSPETLRDHVTRAGQHDPYKASIALRTIRAMLKPPLGAHAQLTADKKWAYEREQWARQAGLKKGRAELEYEPETVTTRALAESMQANEFLPDTAREAVTSISSILAHRANKKLDEHSAAVVGESVDELMHELEVQAQLMQEKDARIQQAERHTQDLRVTNDRLLGIMERVLGKPLSEGALVPAEDREKSGTHQRSN